MSQLKFSESVAPPLNRGLVNKHKVQFVVSLRSVLGEMCKANRSRESLKAAEEVEDVLTESLVPKS